MAVVAGAFTGGDPKPCVSYFIFGFYLKKKKKKIS
jgi:hypothetical protein